MLAYTKGDAYAQAMLPAKPAEMTQAQLTALLAELRAAPELVEKLRLRTYKQLQDRVACLCDLQETILDTYPEGGCGCLRVNKSVVQLLRCWSIDVSGCRPCQGHRRLRALEDLQRAYDELYHSAKERLDYQMQAAAADHAGRAEEQAAIDDAQSTLLAQRLARLKSDDPVAAPAAPDIVLPVDDDAFHADLEVRLARLRSNAPPLAPAISAASGSTPASAINDPPAPAIVAARDASDPPPPTAAVPTALDAVIATTTARLAAHDDRDYIYATRDIETMRERRRRRGSIWSMMAIPYANPVVAWPPLHMLHAAPLMPDAAMEHLLGTMPAAADDEATAVMAHDDFDSTQQAIVAALERGDIDEDEAGLMTTALHPAPAWLHPAGLGLPSMPSAAAAAAPDN
jgi:hypothetical protein